MSHPVDVLVAHQRHQGGCLCGGVGLGQSLPQHQAEVLAAAGHLADDPTDDMLLKSLTANEGHVDLTMEAGGPKSEAVLLAISDACGQMLDEHDATNYVEFTVAKAGRPAYVVNVRRTVGRTPHQLRLAAEKERDELRAEVERLRWDATSRDLSDQAARP